MQITHIHMHIHRLICKAYEEKLCVIKSKQMTAQMAVQAASQIASKTH